MTDDIVSQWRNGLRILHRAHEQATADFTRRGRILSVATLVLTTIVGTSIFATLNSSPATAWKVTAGLISLIAAVLAALQAFLLYPELAERHRQTASKVGDLRRQLDVLVATGTVTTDGLQEIRARSGPGSRGRAGRAGAAVPAGRTRRDRAPVFARGTATSSGAAPVTPSPDAAFRRARGASRARRLTETSLISTISIRFIEINGEGEP